jgi:methionine-rich copper-binding protein CopC
MTRKSLALSTSLLVAGSIALALSAPLAASAHNELVASTPTEGQVLTTLPDAFSITTNENLLELDGSNGFALQIRDAAGAYYGDGCVQVVDATMSATAALGAPGAYTMLWQAVSADGHSVDGEVAFTWQPSGPVQASPALEKPPVCGEAATPEPTASAGQPSASGDPVAQAPTASAIDLPTVLWIGGALLAVGIAIAVAIVLAGRKTKS